MPSQNRKQRRCVDTIRQQGKRRRFDLLALVALLTLDAQEVDQIQTVILLTEEVLLEAMCFDFIVDSPHTELVDLYDAYDDDSLVKEYSWCIAHDS
jgi:hypothetical protein